MLIGNFSNEGNFFLTIGCFLGFYLEAIKNQKSSLGLSVLQHTCTKAQGMGQKWASAAVGAAERAGPLGRNQDHHHVYSVSICRSTELAEHPSLPTLSSSQPEVGIPRERKVGKLLFLAYL